MEVEVSNMEEQYRQLAWVASPKFTQSQVAAYYNMEDLWTSIRDLSQKYAECLKALEPVWDGLILFTHIVERHEISLASFDDLPVELVQQQEVHIQLLKLKNVLQQRKDIVKKLKEDMATLRQKAAQTRFGAGK